MIEMFLIHVKRKINLKYWIPLPISVDKQPVHVPHSPNFPHYST